MRFFCARHRAALCAVFFTLSGWANALPLASNVPGGIALIRLGSQRTESAAPRAWFDERPVFVAAEQGEWVAVLGLALDLPTGRHALRVRLEETEKEDRGTDIILYIDDENKDFLNKDKINSLLTKYCRYLPVPIAFGKKQEWKDGKYVDPITLTSIILGK